MGEGEDCEPDMEAQETYAVSGGQQETALTVRRACAPVIAHFGFSPFLVKV